MAPSALSKKKASNCHSFNYALIGGVAAFFLTACGANIPGTVGGDTARYLNSNLSITEPFRAAPRTPLAGGSLLPVSLDTIGSVATTNRALNKESIGLTIVLGYRKLGNQVYLLGRNDPGDTPITYSMLAGAFRIAHMKKQGVRNSFFTLEPTATGRHEAKVVPGEPQIAGVPNYSSTEYAAIQFRADYLVKLMISGGLSKVSQFASFGHLPKLMEQALNTADCSKLLDADLTVTPRFWFAPGDYSYDDRESGENLDYWITEYDVHLLAEEAEADASLSEILARDLVARQVKRFNEERYIEKYAVFHDLKKAYILSDIVGAVVKSYSHLIHINSLVMPSISERSFPPEVDGVHETVIKRDCMGYPYHYSSTRVVLRLAGGVLR